MKRIIYAPLFMLAAVSLACSLFVPTPKATPTVVAPKEVVAPTEAVVAPTEAVVAPTEAVVIEKATETSAPVVPTATRPIKLPTVEQPTATTAPTETPQGPIEYTETFDKRNDDWSNPIVVTTQASGRDPFIKIGVDGGVLRFAIQDKETYVYKFFLYTVEGNGSIAVTYENRGAQNNGIAVVCKADEDLTEWFEVRLLSGMSEVNFYHYSKKRRTEEGKNPYILLNRTVLAAKEFSPGKSNPFTVTCTDDALSFDINNGKRVVNVDVDTPLDGQLIGLGVMSYDVIPVTIDFDEITITQE